MLKVLGVTFALAFAGAAWFSGQAAVADLAYQENTFLSVQKAVSIAPGNVVFRALLAEHLEGVNQDPKPQLTEITRLSPLDSQYLVRRALRSEIEGKFDEAEALLIQAAKIDRKSSPRWALMNFYFRRGRDAEFWAWVTRALEMNDGSAPSIFRLAWDKSEDSSFILSHFPNRADLTTQYFEFLASTSRLGQAGEVVERAAKVAPESAFPTLLAYCEGYLQTDTPRATTVWNTLCKRKAVPFTPLDPLTGAIITNGDFGIEPTNTGFDWHPKPPDGVLLGQSSDAGKGIRIELNGNQPEDCVILTQVIPLSFGTRYEISWDSAAESSDPVDGLLWELAGIAGEPYGAIAGTSAVTHGKLQFTASMASGLLRLRYKRPLGQVRARGTVAVRALHARVLP